MEEPRHDGHEIQFGSLATACILRTAKLEKIPPTGKVYVPASDVSWQATSILAITSTARATDPRDRIYALYGFLKQGANGLSAVSIDVMKPDYAKSMYTLFREVTRLCIEECENLWSISHGGYLTDRDEVCRSAHDKVPSWVFRLDLEGQPRRHLSRYLVIGLPDEPADDFRVQRLRLESFSACGHRKARIGSHPDSNVLALKGVRVEKIRACSRQFDIRTNYNYETHSIVELWQNITEWLDFDPECKDEDEAHKIATQVVRVIFPTTFTDSSMLRKSQLSEPNDSDVAQMWSTLAIYCRAQQDRWKTSEKAIELYETRGARRKKGEKINADWQNNSKYFVTESGRLGYGPVHMLPGDDLFVLHGSSFLHVLRKCKDEYHHLGEAFVREYVDGSVMRDVEAGIRDEQWVHIR